MSRKGNPSSKAVDVVCRAAVLALPVLVIAGCARGCSHERPYTPYAIDGAPPSVRIAPVIDASITSTGLGGDAGAFAHVAGLRPDASGAFRIDQATSVVPPPGETFILYLVADLDADGIRDAVAWTSSSDPLAGRLLFYKGTSGPAASALPKQLAVLAPGAIGASGCIAEPVLEQIGPATVAISLRSICGPGPLGKTKQRWIAVATPARDPALRQELWLGDPPVGERLLVELEGSDIDGDHRDDLVVRLSVEGAPPPFEQGPRVTADLHWLDRPTGLSRDPDEPEASLRRAAAAELARAAKKAEAPQVNAGVRQIFRLYAWLCSDVGEPLVVIGGGGLRCGPSRALEDAASASVRAALTLNDVPRAVAAFDHMGWRPVTTTKQRRADLEKALLKAAPTRVPSVTRVFTTVPDFEASGVPAWGPLTFTPGGDLLVRTKNGLAMVNVETGVEGAAQGIPSWPPAVTDLDGKVRWSGLYDPCDGIALRVRLGGPSDPLFVASLPGEPPFGARDLPVPVVPPLPSRCFPGGPPVRLESVPVAWGAVGLEGWMAGGPILVSSDLTPVKPLSEVGALGQPVHAGSPRSPDGRALVVGSKLGALVRSGKSWRLWRPSDLEGTFAYSDLRGCTIANDARVVACVRDGRLVGMIGPSAP